MPALGIWSQKLLPNQPQILEIDEDVRITNVTLSDTSNSKQKSFVKILHEPHDDDEEDDDEDENDKSTQEVVLCSLLPGQIEQVSVDLTVTANDLVSLLVTGNNEVHLLGNIVTPDIPYPQNEESDEDEDDEDDDESDMNSEDMKLIYGDVDQSDDEIDDDESGPKIEEITDSPVKQGTKRQTEEEKPKEKKKKNEKGQAEKVKEEPKKTKEESKKTDKKTEKSSENKRVTLSKTISYEDAKQGTGPAAKAGKKIGMRYIGKLLKDGKPSGKPFDSNTSGKPFYFTVGRGECIEGFDVGILGTGGGEPMKVGGERRLFIGSKSAYGNTNLPGIGKNKDLTFDVRLVEVR